MPNRTPIATRFWAKVIKGGPGECWQWTAANIRGYGVIGTGGRRGPTVLAHVLSYRMHHPLTGDWREYGYEVLHSCDNRSCVNPAHLRLGTRADNMQDMYSRGRENRRDRVRGEAHHAAKLTVDQVLAIRDDQRILDAIAADYGISRVTASRIRRREIWRHV